MSARRAGVLAAPGGVLAALGGVLAALLTLAAPTGAAAQAFFASRAHPQFTIGPIFVRANIAPGTERAEVSISFSLTVPPEMTGSEVEQDLYLLWPGTVRSSLKDPPRDAALPRFVEARGYTALAQGVLPLGARDIYGGLTTEKTVAAAPWVTFRRERAEQGPTAPATWIRIPWRPEMVNRTRLMSLRFTSDDIVKRQPATWVEETFRGRRHVASISFHEVRNRGIFPLYLEHRDHLIRLAEDPSQLSLGFRDPARLKIESVAPPSATRRLTEMRDTRQVVAVFLDRAQGLTPQVVTVEFGYFSGIHAWMPILIPILFFLLGNLAAVLVRVGAERLSRAMSGRVFFGRRKRPTPRDTGVIAPRDLLAKIAPGATTYDEVTAMLGPTVEEREQLGGSAARTLVYRGRRLLPQGRRTFGWIATTVDHWVVEDHELEVHVADGRVRNVQARVRRSRLTSPEADQNS